MSKSEANVREILRCLSKVFYWLWKAACCQIILVSINWNISLTIWLILLCFGKFVNWNLLPFFFTQCESRLPHVEQVLIVKEYLRGSNYNLKPGYKLRTFYVTPKIFSFSFVFLNRPNNPATLSPPNLFKVGADRMISRIFYSFC